jgi:excisionase family DNA binding protein
MSAPNTPLPPLDINQRYTVEECIRYLRSSRATVYRDIAQGRLRTITEGSRRYIPASEIIRRSTIAPVSPS